MARPSPSDNLAPLQQWYQMQLGILHATAHDLSARQVCLLLTVYLSPEVHTLKSLAVHLDISKPATCRAIDALCRYGYIKRKRGEEDRRQVYIQRTVKGSVFLSEMADVVRKQAAPAGIEPGS